MESRKIVFTDFFGTLASKDIRLSTKEGISECRRVQNFLNQYLNNQNFMYIISSVDHVHMSFFDKIFSDIAEGVTQDKLTNLFIYISGANTMDKNPTYRLIEKHIVPDTSIVVNRVYGRKEDVVGALVDSIDIKETDKIIAAGDSPCDVNMLFKIHNMGGESYYVNSYYTHAMEDKSVSSLINSIACNNLDCSMYGTDEWQQAYTSIYDKWLNEYKSGIVNREKLEYVYSLLEIHAMHNLCYGNNEKIFPVDLSDYEKKLILVKSSDEVLRKFNG